MLEPENGRRPVHRAGFTYLPRFIEPRELEGLIAYFAAIRPLWEQRHRDGQAARAVDHGRRLTRPVYWLGAWQFACLGYYAEPDHRENRCVRAEAFPAVMQDVLERLRPILEANHCENGDGRPVELPNTCLINYYGREVGLGTPVDYARLRMHRDREPGPVVMFSVGQPGLLEFLDPAHPKEPELGVWTRHGSVTVLSGPDYKDRLYHRVSRVRTGRDPVMRVEIPNFELRRVSVSFRSVPPRFIRDFGELPIALQDQVRDYMEELARDSAHFRRQSWRPERVAEAREN
ncbi:MAG: alpha-ketoglutarate-dependent dioxygenase AlkB [Nannocystaceae bacterium]